MSVGIAFQRKIGVGLFGGEGFIMQKLEGDGLCFVHAGGTIHHLDLAAGETLRVDTGCLVALQPSVNYDIQFVGKIKTALFGGEGIFFATLQGPGPRVAAVAAAQPHGRSHLQGRAADRRAPQRRGVDPRPRRRAWRSDRRTLTHGLAASAPEDSRRWRASRVDRRTVARRVADDDAPRAEHPRFWRPCDASATPSRSSLLPARSRPLAACQPRTAFPEKRGLKLTDFPRVVKIADNVYGYEDIRNPA